MNKEHLNELLYQTLETELGGVEVYTTALKCAQNDELKEEWEKYLDQTRNHVQIVQNVMKEMGLDLEAETPGRKVVRHTGESLVKAMEMALKDGKPEEAQLVAAECITLAETKDHLNWHLIGEAAKKATTDVAKVLKAWKNISVAPSVAPIKLPNDGSVLFSNPVMAWRSLARSNRGIMLPPRFRATV